LKILDISNPGNFALTGRLIGNNNSHTSFSYPTSIYVNGNYAYIASAINGGLVIIDISNPTSPIIKGYLAHGPDGSWLAPSATYVKGNYAYISNESEGYKGLEIVDITNPEVPVHKGNLHITSWEGLYNTTSSIFVSGNYAYMTSGRVNALEIVDVTDPANPLHKATLSDGDRGAMLNSPSSVYVSGKYAFVISQEGNSLEIINIENPTAPIHQSNISNGVGGAQLYHPSSVVISGDYAYITSSNALEIIWLYSPITAIESPNEYRIGIYPNPTHESVTFLFQTNEKNEEVTIEVYDLIGQKIKTIGTNFGKGMNEVQWDCQDDQGKRVSNGTYIYRLIGNYTPASSGRLIVK
jgi:hypothetical protein